MATIRAMFIGTGGSGLAEDKVVNTFYFNNVADPYFEHMTAVKAALDDFYNGVGVAPDLQTQTVSSYLSPWIARPAEFRFYDMSTAKPRVPDIFAEPISGPIAAVGLPEEVALCVTVMGDPPITRRRRGRFYVGPLINSASFASSGTSAPTRPSIEFVTNVRHAATRLMGTPGLGWSIHSMVPAENYVTITRGYIDNAFDTQRRRGPDASSRQEWEDIL